MKKLEDILIAPKKGDSRRSRLAIHGNGGAGKTHLAMEFVQRHQEGFSAVFWLDGTTRAAFRQSLAACASLIPQGQISERSRLYSQSGSIKGQSAVISDVVDWLSREDNTRWLLVVDNVGSNIELERLKALEETDGSILVITREEKVENIGFPHASLARVSTDEAKVIFAKWNDKLYSKAFNEAVPIESLETEEY
jgi:Ni2+-binding GTPase involved in maturation of urease and hydrogenase